MKVLIAEDDGVSRHMLQNFLEKWGYDVVATSNGKEAWGRFQDEEFPLIISDWMMPEMDGLELIRHVRARQQPGYVYIILLTALAQKKDVVEGMSAGADDFVTKPFDRDELRVRLRAGERIIHLERSLTEQNRVLRETQAALIQSENLASLGQLAAGMAHEINNPVAYVTNNLAVLRRDLVAALSILDKYREGRAILAQVAPGLAAEAARMEAVIDLAYTQDNLARLLEKSIEGLQRVRDIVNNLRDFARSDELEWGEEDLVRSLVSTIEVLGHEIRRKGIRIETRFQELPPVPCHPGKMNQAFLNVLLNAVQACGPGGVIKVSTWTEPSGEAVVGIKDNGRGISPEQLPHIFEPFFTTKLVGEGKGLGLSVSYGIIRAHGGSITVESTPGRGSAVLIRIPLKSPV